MSAEDPYAAPGAAVSDPADPAKQRGQSEYPFESDISSGPFIAVWGPPLPVWKQSRSGATQFFMRTLAGEGTDRRAS
ncbi:hypothetical protein [Pseudoxanthomonas yeongjuensis]|jgi:hypothetical protein|uniref:hypothetical protein n=1 Tax=Pseudoxanthomonas yeongjuensis TaxID=377616 RepID=UPI0013919820|nr:hypothetical protein [Pseudoxanthomonas yeongjuensis]